MIFAGFVLSIHGYIRIDHHRVNNLHVSCGSDTFEPNKEYTGIQKLHAFTTEYLKNTIMICTIS